MEGGFGVGTRTMRCDECRTSWAAQHRCCQSNECLGAAICMPLRTMKSGCKRHDSGWRPPPGAFPDSLPPHLPINESCRFARRIRDTGFGWDSRGARTSSSVTFEPAEPRSKKVNLSPSELP